MGRSTGIAWTDSTWNPWRGCHKVSPGCSACYMFREQERYGRDPGVVVRAAPKTFRSPLLWTDRRRVFTCSWSDWFIEEADPWRDEAWEVVRMTPHLTYQVLTKRPELIRDRLPADWGDGYPNVWLGVSIETPMQLPRASILNGIPAALRFVSAEPLLKDICLDGELGPDKIGWVIVGGESGGRPGRPPRPMKAAWARHIVDDCRFAGVPVFFKQWGGGAVPDKGATLDGCELHEFPNLGER